MFRSLCLAAATLAVLAAPAAAQTSWTIDSNHSAAQFSVRHMMVSTVRGNLGKISGTVEFDGKNFGGLAVDAVIDVAGIDTRVEDRDTHLKGADFFDVASYPTMMFRSKRAEPVGDGRFRLIGDLTMHGVTKEVVLDVEGPSAELRQKDSARVGAVATTKINRKDFGLTWNRALEAGGVTVGDEVAVTLDLELTRKIAVPG